MSGRSTRPAASLSASPTVRPTVRPSARPTVARRLAPVASSLVAAALLAASLSLPLWGMRMNAPQYPAGLHLRAYGDVIVGDLREINIINHYIGMAEIGERPAPEMALFGPTVLALILLALAAPLHRWLRWLAMAAVAATPLVILADLQLWLHRFGQDLDPMAPIRVAPFTPLALGPSSVGNFTTVAWPGLGILCMVAALVALAAGGLAERRNRAAGAATAASPRGRRVARPAVALPAVLLAGGLGLLAPAAEGDLQQRIDAAPRGATVVVDGGVHRGPLTVTGPLTVLGSGRPVIDGGGRGSVVTLLGEGVTFGGFVVRNSGRQVTEEAAGIAVRGDRHRVEGNRVEDVYFGIHVAGGGGHRIAGNDVEPGQARGARPGHGISLWSVRDSTVAGNRIRQARDGIYLSFVERILVEDNEVSDCRYALHSMYSQEGEVIGNRFRRNLLGAALMYSRSLRLAGNLIAEHRTGATPYGILLKDIDDLVVEGNRLVRNRVGLYADGVAQTPGSEAGIRGNVIAGHEAGLMLQSNARVTVAGNVLLDNLVDVRAGGDRLAAGNRWSEGGRGNFWSQYRGYDRDRDGVGDRPHRVEGAMEELLRRDVRVQAFLYTPAHLALEAAVRMFPLFRPQPLLVDEAPLLKPPTLERSR